MKKSDKKITTVHQHLRHVPISKKNPNGVTTIHQHLRRLKGTYLDSIEINKVFKEYDRTSLTYPSTKKLPEFRNADHYDHSIAIWTDYFNKKFNSDPPLDPDIIKALIASESGFRPDPPENRIATGITQITKETLRILQDPKDEAKDFIFNKVRQKDLKIPDIAIPMAIRWLFRKKETARSKLAREPNSEELILEYKGMLKSGSRLKEEALKNFRENYARLKQK